MHLPPAPPRLGRFEILERLGEGRTGITWRARTRVAFGGLPPGSEVALKVLHPHLVEDQRMREAFLREARAGMRVRHPHLVRVYAVEEVLGRDGRVLYLVLELLRGQTVRHWLEEAGLATEPTLRTLGAQVAGALAALHAAGLLHLDVKPENLMWDEDRAVLLDLGFVRPESGGENAGQGAGSREAAPAASTASSSGMPFLGTPAYAAPELLLAGRLSPAADLFSLGVTLYECATGLRPFGDEGRFGLFEARRTAVVRRPSTIQPRLSPFFDALVLWLLASDPGDRPASALEVQQILQQGEQSSWWREQGEPEPRLHVLPRSPLPLADRLEEIGSLQAAFHEAVQDREPLLLDLCGPPGVGKTRLAFELGRRVRLRPDAPPFLYGRYPRLGSFSVFQALRDALSRSLGLVPGEPPHPVTRRRLEASLPPGGAATLLGILEGRAFNRGRRHRAFLDWFRALGEEGPFVLFLDDVQEAGPPLWALLGEALQESGLPALFLTAGRETEGSPEARRARADVTGHPRARRLRLGALPEAEVRTLLRRLFEPGELSERLAADFLAACRGNPGILADILRLLRGRGELQGRPGSLRPARRPLRIPLTGDEEAILRQEFEGLREEERDLLAWAAILQPPVTPSEAARLAGRSETRTARLLATLAERGWLDVEQGGYRFARPAQRAAIWRALEKEDRRARHRRAHALLSLEAQRHRPGSTALYVHAHFGALHAEALRHGLPLLERLLAQGAFPRAELTLEQLQEHAAALGESRLSLELRCRLAVARARLAGRAGRHEEEARLLREAGRLAHELDDDHLRARVHLGLARHARSLGLVGAARIHLARVRELGGVEAGSTS